MVKRGNGYISKGLSDFLGPVEPPRHEEWGDYLPPEDEHTLDTCFDELHNRPGGYRGHGGGGGSGDQYSE